MLHLVSASNIRLTSSYQGLIQIKDGSTWRFVKEENWDKRRQKILCQLLGFSENNEIASRYELKSGYNIATGHLICYKPHSKGVSCCVHLTPSKNEKTVSIPYAKCKCTFMTEKYLVLDSRFLTCGFILWLLELFAVAVVVI